MNTCGTCAHRDENGSCEIDVLDPDESGIECGFIGDPIPQAVAQCLDCGMSFDCSPDTDGDIECPGCGHVEAAPTVAAPAPTGAPMCEHGVIGCAGVIAKRCEECAVESAGQDEPLKSTGALADLVALVDAYLDAYEQSRTDTDEARANYFATRSALVAWRRRHPTAPALPPADLVALVEEMQAAGRAPAQPGRARYFQAIQDVLAWTPPAPSLPPASDGLVIPPADTIRKVVAGALDAMEHGATALVRRAAWNALRDAFYPTVAALPPDVNCATCGHPESAHESLPYRGEAPRWCCYDLPERSCPCRAFTPVAALPPVEADTE